MTNINPHPSDEASEIVIESISPLTIKPPITLNTMQPNNLFFQKLEEFNFWEETLLDTFESESIKFDMIRLSFDLPFNESLRNGI